MRLVARATDARFMEDRTFPAVLHRFDRHLDVIGRADATRRRYRYELLCWWTDYLFPGELEVADVRPGHVEEYLGRLPRNGSKRGDAIRALRAFFGWAVVEGEVDRDPAAHIPIPRPRTGPAPDLSDNDLRRLLRAAFRREPRRGWAILLCYVTGARVGSLVAAKPADVHLGPDARIDLLEAKGGKPYSVPLERAGVIAATHLQGYNESARSFHPSAEGARLVGVGAERFRQWVHAAEQDLLRHAASTRSRDRRIGRPPIRPREGGRSGALGPRECATIRRCVNALRYRTERRMLRAGTRRRRRPRAR